MLLKPCEIIYVKEAKGWKWRSVAQPPATAKTSEETFGLFYDAVSAARARGYSAPIKCR